MARYQFYVAPNKVICVSSYAKKPVRGVAKCNPNDVFDEEKGRRLAQLRCDYKVAQKRFYRLFNDVKQRATEELIKAQERYKFVANLATEAQERCIKLAEELRKFEDTLN